MRKALHGRIYAIKIDAGHDVNGNPKRGWLLYDIYGGYHGFVDEGYKGRDALKQCCPKATELATIPTTGATYRSAKADRVN